MIIISVYGNINIRKIGKGEATFMIETEPLFLENEVLAPEYYETPDPYRDPPECHVNLLELSRYAKSVGKKLVELTKEEVERFTDKTA